MGKRSQPTIHQQMDAAYQAMNDQEKIAALTCWHETLCESYRRIGGQRDALLSMAKEFLYFLYWQEIQTSTVTQAKISQWNRIERLAAILGIDQHELAEQIKKEFDSGE